MIRAKLLLRNVFKKKLRSAIMILSLAAAAFAALFCISGINTSQNGLRDFFRSTFGDTTMLVSNVNGEVNLKPDDLPSDCPSIEVVSSKVSKTIQNERFVNYVNQISIFVLGLDTEKAAKLRLLDGAYPTKDGATITINLAIQLNVKEGDDFQIYGADGKEYTLKVLKVVPNNHFLKMNPLSMLVTPELAKEIRAGKNAMGFLYVAVPDERLEGTISNLTKKHPEYVVTSIISDDSDDAMNSMLNIYYLIFAVVFLMVCFIVVSMSKHIVIERMSVIGMLRSIGGSIRSTGRLLMLETAFYGLCGSVIGCLIFLPLKELTVLEMFAGAGMEGEQRSDGINFLTVSLVILAVTLIPCLFSAFSIFKASRTPVRDIIFGTKETAYQPSKLFAVIGLILLAVGICAYFMFHDFMMTIVAAFCSAIGVVLLFPMLLSWISKGLAALFAKMNMPVAKLAVKEIASTKSSVSSSQLILSAISLTIAVLILAVSIIQMMSSPYFQSELIITSATLEGSQYMNAIPDIDGVQDVEMLFYNYSYYENKAQINGEDRDTVVMGFNDGGFKYFNGIRNCPAELSDDEIAVDKVFASRLSLNPGDEMTLKLKVKNYLPSEKKYRIKNLIDSTSFNSMGNTILMSLNAYKNVFYDKPSTILIKTMPGKELEILSILHTTLPDDPMSVKTRDQYLEEMASSMQGILTIIYAVIVLGLALSLMGTSSNMLMGFEQSRRKYAVFYSSSMSKDKLKKLILLETVFVSGISVIAALLFGMYFLGILDQALTMLDLSVPMVTPLPYALLFGAAAFVVLLIVVVKPIRMLSKMNIAEEIKTSAD